MSSTAIALAITATGAARIKTVVLLTPEEVDQATKKSVKYRAPGKLRYDGIFDNQICEKSAM